MRELQSVLKRVVRAMSFAAYREAAICRQHNSLPLFNDLRIFTMANINKHTSFLFVYKALGKENQMFDIVANANYNVRSNHQMLLQVPNIRTAHSRQGVEWRGWRSGTPSLQRSGCPLPTIPLSAGLRGFCWESRRFRHSKCQMSFRFPSTLPSLYGRASSLCICVPSSICWLELLNYNTIDIAYVCLYGRIMLICNVGGIRYFMLFERRMSFISIYQPILCL